MVAAYISSVQSGLTFWLPLLVYARIHPLTFIQNSGAVVGVRPVYS